MISTACRYEKRHRAYAYITHGNWVANYDDKIDALLESLEEVEVLMFGEIFCCPKCKAALSHASDQIHCPSCELAFPVRDGVPDFFLPGVEKPDDRNLSYHDSAMAEAKDLYYRKRARQLKGMAFCMDEIGRRTFSNCRILEVGLGTGRFTCWLAEAADPGSEIYAFDFSWPMLERARTNTDDFPNVALFRANARGPLPFAPETFDIVLVRLAPLNPEGMPRGAFDLLKPGGLYFSATTASAEIIEVPPTKWAAEQGYENAEYHIWRYPRVTEEGEYLASIIEGPRLPYLVPDLEKAREVIQSLKEYHGCDEGIPGIQVEGLLIAQKPA